MVIALTNANPDYYRAVVADAGPKYRERTIIYSTIKSLAVGQLSGASAVLDQVRTDANLTIYALNLLLATPIVIRGGDVRIYCKTLEIPPDAKVVIDVSDEREHAYEGGPYRLPQSDEASQLGKHGDDIAKALQATADPMHNKYGTAGNKGGSITLICDTIILNGELSLLANGSRGYPGCRGSNGVSPGGRGGNGGRGGSGGNGGRIEVRYRTATSTHLTAAADPGAAGEQGPPGEGGEPDGSVRRGDPGEHALPVDSGIGGTVIQHKAVAAARLGPFFDKIFFLKLFQKVKLLYLFNSPKQFTGSEPTIPDKEKWAELGTYLKWLVEVLADYASAAKDDPEFVYKQRFFKSASILKLRYDTKRTYFNWPANQVPARPFAKYVELFRNSFENRSKIETAFLALSQTYETAAEEQLALDKQKENLIATTNIHLAKYDCLLQEREKLPERIETAFIALTAASTALQAELSMLKSVIESHFMCPSLTDILKAAEMMAFTVGGEGGGMAAMGAVEVATMVNDGMTKIELDNGTKIEKASIVKEITGLSAALNTYTKGAVAVPDEHGNPVLDPKKKILLTTLSAFEDTVTGMSKTLDENGTPLTKEAVATIHAFRTAIYEKGEALLAYQVLTMRMVEEYEAYLEAKDALEKLDKKQPLGPYFVSTVSYFAKLYQDQLDQVAENLSLMERKFAYETLDYKSEINLEKAFGAMWLDGVPPEKTDMTQLAARVNQMQDLRAEFESGATSAPYVFPDPELGPNQRSDLKVVIAEGHVLLKTLIDTGECTFTTVRPPRSDDRVGEPPSTAPIAQTRYPEVPVENSEQVYDVRISHVHPRVIGAKHEGYPDSYVLVKARIDRETSLYDHGGTRYTFAHPLPRETDFRHLASTSANGTDNSDIGSGGTGKLDAEYLDQMGLFGNWTIKIPDQKMGDNAKLDRSGITALVIHFCGLRRGGILPQ